MRALPILALWLTAPMAAPTSAMAGDLAVTVRTARGAPVADAVVSISAPAAGPIRFAWPYRMAQRDKEFEPFVLVVPVGAEVAFPNLDSVRHHVYSFSPAKTFELKLYGRDETRVVRFDKAGVVELGCNIHDNMKAFIDVVDTPYVARTDEQGVAVIHNAPPGAQAVKVWRPYLRAPGNSVSLSVNVPREGVGRAEAKVELRPAPEMNHQMY